MQLGALDWTIISIFFAIIIGIGIVASRTAGKNTSEFFLGGRHMPWWLLGISMVACTFSCDTPNLVTDMVRGGGVSKNWAWWAFLITGMVTVFIYAQLWRRSKLMTDLEFYEVRYSGKGAALLRGFRAVYLGFFFNCLIMGTVSLAAIKIGGVMLDLPPFTTIVGASVFVVIYTSLGGIKGVIWSDFFQYSIAMVGAVYAAYVAVNLPEVGGLTNLLTHENVAPKLNFTPQFNDWVNFVPLLIIPIAVQWWSVWYPGAEPGGGGYIAQKMLSAKDEKNAVGATLLFNFMHYAVRPWPWVLVALASIIAFPELTDIKEKFPNVDPKYLKDDVAYPAMLTFLSPGWLGIVVASLIAAYMSTIGTHLNWGSSYLVNDFYNRFVDPQASQKKLVMVGRICTVLLMVTAGTLALTILESAGQAFSILLLSGAGTGLVYLLRWFWWRINAFSEIAAMVAATVMAFWLVLGLGDKGMESMIARSGIVNERVEIIDNPQLTQQTLERLDELAAAGKTLKQEVEDTSKVWKTAQKKGDETAITTSKTAYEAALKLYADNQDASEIPAILEEFAKADNQLAGDLAAFTATLTKQHQARQKDQDKDIEVSLGGVINGERIILFDSGISELVFSAQLLLCILVVTTSWLVVTFLTKPTSATQLKKFYELCHPGGPGWRKFLQQAQADGVTVQNSSTEWQMPLQVLLIFLGCFAIYGALFCIGSFIYGNLEWGVALGIITAVSTVAIFKLLGKLRMK